MKRAIIMGATSGIGHETALLLLKEGWSIGIAGRRTARLEEMKLLAPERICTAAIDVTQEDAGARLEALADALGGMDLYVHCSGIGHQNYELEPAIELDTVATNAAGFVRMTDAAFRYFLKKGKGHIAALSYHRPYRRIHQSYTRKSSQSNLVSVYCRGKNSGRNKCSKNC